MKQLNSMAPLQLLKRSKPSTQKHVYAANQACMP